MQPSAASNPTRQLEQQQPPQQQAIEQQYIQQYTQRYLQQLAPNRYLIASVLLLGAGIFFGIGLAVGSTL